MSKLYNSCTYQLYFHIINTDSTQFTANTVYNYLNTHYGLVSTCPVVGCIQSTTYDEKLLVIPYDFYADTSPSASDNQVVVECVFINGDNIEGNPANTLTFYCRNVVTNCHDTVIPLLNL